MSGLLNLKRECNAIEERVLEAHDVVAIDEGEHGEVREVQHEIVTGDTPPIRQPVRRIPFALREKVAGLVDEMLRGVIRESSFFLLYGREARLPADSVLDSLPSPYVVDCEDYQTELARGLATSWEMARSMVWKAQQHQKKQYDKIAKPVTYHEGTRVMVFMPKETRSKNRKLALPYHGPYCVLEVRQNCLLMRPVDRPDDEPILVNMDRVVECSEELPNTLWLGKQRRCSIQRRGREVSQILFKKLTLYAPVHLLSYCTIDCYCVLHVCCSRGCKHSSGAGDVITLHFCNL